LSQEKISDLAKQVGVDEIHVIDDKGIIRYGTAKDFYGFDFGSSEQTKYLS
jgi:methyl-accepting chemotaxis protein